MHINTYRYAITIDEKEARNLKESREVYKGGFGEWKGKRIVTKIS